MLQRCSDLYSSVLSYIEHSGIALSEKKHPLYAVDYSIYSGDCKFWFTPEYSGWNQFLCHAVKSNCDGNSSYRPVVRIVPYIQPTFNSKSAASQHWQLIKCCLHMMLHNGVKVQFLFDDKLQLDNDVDQIVIIPHHVSIETSDLHSGNFDTEIYHDRRHIDNQFDLLQSYLRTEAFDDISPGDQKVFELIYNKSTFTCGRDTQTHLRQTFGRFLYRLQQGLCPGCGTGKRHRFERMELDHILPVSKNGNNSILNLQMLCYDCNRKDKRDYVVSPIDYFVFLKNVVGFNSGESRTLGPIFRQDLQIKRDSFPFAIAMSAFEPKLRNFNV